MIIWQFLLLAGGGWTTKIVVTPLYLTGPTRF
jgi:hypothetical protein